MASSSSSLQENDEQQVVLDDFSYDGIPETDASLPSRLTFFWMRPMFRRAAYLHRHGQALEHEDLLPLPEKDHGATVQPIFDKAWDEHNAKAKNINKVDDDSASSWSSTRVLRKSLWSVIGKKMIGAGFVKVFNTALQFGYPLLLNAILKFIEDMQAGKLDESEQNRGYWLGALLFCIMALKAMMENLYFQTVYRASFQARVAVSCAVYEKALRMANSERQGTTLGELVNLMQVDATKIEMFIPQFHVLWDGLLQIVGYMVILYTLIGWPCFAGLIVMMLSAPVQTMLMGKQFALNRHMVQYTDSRVKSTNEALQGIRCVKMYSWEESFFRLIAKSRDMEMGVVKETQYLRGFSRAYMEALPGIVAVTSFVVYALATDNANISASTLFAALAAFDQLRFPLLFYPMTLAQLAQAAVSAVRVEKFLQYREVGSVSDDEDHKGGSYTRNQEGSKGEIRVEEATIYWQDPDVPIASVSQHSSVSMSAKSVSKSVDGDSKSVADEQTADVDESGSDHAFSEEEPIKNYPKPILSDTSLNIAPGELCAVVGRVGCGKSTLCNAILNETVLGGGHIALNGSVAYAAQTPWVLNATLRDNILFGMPMDKEKYDKVIDACQLRHDLSLLKHGDLTEIGERGINLSGGQKQRVSVARAAYSNADVVILDDPLSALDPAVAMQLFHECIVKFMKGRTRLLVTNALQCVHLCDSIVALGHGRVIEKGTYEELSKNDGGEVQRLLQDLKKKSSGGDKKTESDDDETAEEAGDDEEDATATEQQTTAQKDDAKLVTKEERNIGAVSWSIYKRYFVSGGGYVAFAFVFFWFILCSANSLMNSVWVTLWTSDSDYERQSQGFYLGLYGLTAVTLGVFTFFRTAFLSRFGVNASTRLHENLLSSVLHATMAFFDTTPTGRVLSRFSKDMHSIDQELSIQMDFFFFAALTVMVALGTILFVTPWFGVAVVPIMFVYYKVLNYFREVSRETKRLESISRSPVYAHFSETLGGLPEIRAYGQTTRFLDNFEGKIDQNTRANYCNKSADRWLAVRLETIGATIASCAAIFAVQVVVSDGASAQRSDDNFASLAGLSLTYAISVTSLLNWCVRTFAQLEAAMNSCERVLYYTDEIEHEAPSSSKELQDHVDSLQSDKPDKSDPSAYAVVAAGGTINPPPEWPTQGAITFKNLFMRYRPETPLVLKGLNVAIAGGERVGVVGRTGSGKSSLLLSLLRMVEPDLSQTANDYQPPLQIDGVDLLRIGLRDLRSKLGIIPQNPVLFSGTVRSNIDPFDDYTDEQIWRALEQCAMKEAVEGMPDGLLAPVSEYGENLSQGQRQLLCLGRAVLKQCSVLLLDEATSSVDYETDRSIQQTLRNAFPGTTVLTVAHRVNTIMDSDKILVMSDGLAVEFAPPTELLSKEDSIFSEIVRHAEAERN